MENWRPLDGWAVSRNMPPLDEMELRRFCNLVYWWATKDAENDAAVKRFEARLWQPPKGVAPAPGSPWSPEAENAAFGAFKAAVNA